MARPMSPLRTRNEVARFSARSISRVAEARSDAPLAAAFERVGSGAAQAACGEVGGGAMVGAGVGTGHGSWERGATDGGGGGACPGSRPNRAWNQKLLALAGLRAMQRR